MHLKYSDTLVHNRLRLLSVEYCCHSIVGAILNKERLLSIVTAVDFYDQITHSNVLCDSTEKIVSWCPYCGAKIKSEMVSPPKGASFSGNGSILISPDYETHPEYYEDEALDQRAAFQEKGRMAIYISGQYKPEKH